MALPLEALHRRRGRCHRRRSVIEGGHHRKGLCHSVAGGDAATGGTPSLEGATAGGALTGGGSATGGAPSLEGAIVEEEAAAGGGHHWRGHCHWRRSITEGGAATGAAALPEGARSALERDERKMAGGGRCSI